MGHENFSCAYRGESVIIINGTLKKLILASQEILQRVDDFYSKNNKNFSDHSLKIVMNTNHVNKLIGIGIRHKILGGKLIQDIAKKSGAP